MTALMQTLRVETCLLLPEHLAEEVPYTPDVATVGGLLHYLSRRIDFALLDGEGAVIRELDVTVNGRDLAFCPAGLATPLQPDDRVSIHFIPLGGG